MALVLLTVLLLAFANGANDNAKGVATLFGSHTLGWRRAILFATVATFLGSAAAVILAGKLLAAFQGKGLVAPELAGEPGFLTAVALGAGLTVLLASRLGLPTSTTHALVGALVGAGLAASSQVELGRLGRGFALPLLTSPLLATAGALALYPALRGLRRRWGVTRMSCLCVGRRVLERIPLTEPLHYLERRRVLSLCLGDALVCREGYQGRVLGLGADSALTALHLASAGAVSFARGLNDTPKIAALLLVLPGLGPTGALLMIGLAIALGGLVAAARVGQTMGFGITGMNAGQGLAANLVTSTLVLGAGLAGLPVSTTHVSVGSLFGLGLARGSGRERSGEWGRILFTWLVTLPLAGAIAAAVVRWGP